MSWRPSTSRRIRSSFARLALDAAALEAVPVDDATGHPPGMVTRDVLDVVDDEMTFGDVMIQDCVTVRGDETVEQVRSELSDTAVNVTWILDESNVLVGAVSAARLGLSGSMGHAARDTLLEDHL
jgi:Mg/Co/Ni transporter MgtE